MEEQQQVKQMPQNQNQSGFSLAHNDGAQEEKKEMPVAFENNQMMAGGKGNTLTSVKYSGNPPGGKSNFSLG